MSSKKYNSCILTSYFCVNPHPQRFDVNNKIEGINKNGMVLQDSWRYISKLYSTSLDKQCDIFIFYDSLSDDFINKYSSGNINFIRVEPSLFSNNDYRFKCYLDFLEANPYEKVFMSDLCDVRIAMDPSEIEVDFELFFCEDTIGISNYYFESISYFEMHRSFGWDNEEIFKDNNFKVLNMGVIGGNYDNVYKFLSLFCDLRIKAGNPNLNINMALGNYIARNFFSDIRYGFPYCSEFKKYQTERKDVFFIHK
mgnify:CR=1 FL=1